MALIPSDIVMSYTRQHRDADALIPETIDLEDPRTIIALRKERQNFLVTIITAFSSILLIVYTQPTYISRNVHMNKSVYIIGKLYRN